MTNKLLTSGPPTATVGPIQHYEHKIEGTPCLYKPALHTLVQRSRDDDVIVLVGLNEGRALAYLGVEIILSRKAIQLIGCDQMNPAETSRMLGVIRPMSEIAGYNVRLAPMDPVKFPDQLDRRSIDSVWFEGYASEKLMRTRLRAWLPVIKIGGYLGGSNVILPEVKKTVAEIAPEGFVYYDVEADIDTDWWSFQKTKS